MKIGSFDCVVPTTSANAQRVLDSRTQIGSYVHARKPPTRPRRFRVNRQNWLRRSLRRLADETEAGDVTNIAASKTPKLSAGSGRMAAVNNGTFAKAATAKAQKGK